MNWPVSLPADEKPRGAPRLGYLTAEVTFRGIDSEVLVEVEEIDRRQHMVRINCKKIHCSGRMARRIRRFIPDWINEDEYEIEWIEEE